MPTLLLFGPRWAIALPLVLLLPLGVYFRSRWAIGLTLLAGLVVAGPVTGGTVNPARLVRSERPALVNLRVVTWNTGVAKPGPAFRRFLDQVNPDVVLIQEGGAEFGPQDFPDGWSLNPGGRQRVASRYPVRQKAEWTDPKLRGAVWCALDTPGGEVSVVDVHLPSVRPGMEGVLVNRFSDLTELRAIIEFRKAASRIVRDFVKAAGPDVIVAGDFNMPVESRIYREDWSSFRNAFSEAGLGWGTTFHTRRIGLRIDHILYTPRWECRGVRVGPDLGSDHRPVIADLARVDD